MPPAMVLQAEPYIEVNGKGNDGPDGVWTIDLDIGDHDNQDSTPTTTPQAHSFSFGGTYTTERFRATLYDGRKDDELRATKTVDCVASAPDGLRVNVGIAVVTADPFVDPVIEDAAEPGIVCTPV
ncbi:hypothetical protein IAT40_004924 [Kwoniella sp. CBS 6097]